MTWRDELNIFFLWIWCPWKMHSSYFGRREKMKMTPVLMMSWIHMPKEKKTKKQKIEHRFMTSVVGFPMVSHVTGVSSGVGAWRRSVDRRRCRIFDFHYCRVSGLVFISSSATFTLIATKKHIKSQKNRWLKWSPSNLQAVYANRICLAQCV